MGDVIHHPEGVCAACHCGNNIAVVLVLDKRAAKNTCMNHLLRTFYAAIYKFHFLTEHIPGIRNTAANALSRNDITSFSRIFPQVLPVEVLAVVLDEVVGLTQIGARCTALSCSGALCSGRLPPHSQCLPFRYKAVCCLLPASASPTSQSFRSHIVSLCV